MLLSPWELVHIFILIYSAQGQDTFNCEWGAEEHVRRFVEVPENAPVGSVAFEVNVSRPDMLRLNSSKDENLAFLSPIPATERKGQVIVASQLDRLALDDGSSVVKYSLFCGNNPVSQQINLYVVDVNNHRPVFLDRNITVSVDELTPIGLVVLPEIRVYDEDKPNTANSEIELFLESQTAFVVDENFTDLEYLQLSTHNKRKRTSTRNSRDFNKVMLRREENVHYFSMNDVKKGEIQLIQALDYDFGAKRFELLVVAKDMGQPPLSSSATVVVNVIDNDDSSPKFTAKRYIANVYEHSGTDRKQNIREEIITEPSAIKAYDGDRGIDAALQYSILKGEFSSYFSIDSNSGQLFLVKHLDRESLKEDTMIIHLLARQVDNIGREASTEVHITIKDVNDHLPSFENDIYAISIVENLPAGFSVVQVSAFDPDIDENGEFIYYVNKNDTPLTVNPETGWLTVTNQSMLDREESGLLTLQVCTKQKRPLANNFNNVDEKQARELFVGKNNPQILKDPAQSSVTFPPVPDKVTPAAINVQSISPQVRSLPPSALLRERLHIVGNTPTLEGGGPLSVTGPIEKPFLSRKENSFGRLLASRRLLSQGKQLFHDDDVNMNQTHEEKGHIITKREAFNNQKLNKIDRAINHPIELRNASKTPCATIRLTLLDANDNNPVFIPSNHYEFIIMDDIEIGEVVGTVKAVDNDSGVNGVVKYKLQKQAQEDDSVLSNINQFIIDEKTGVLRVTSLVTAGEITLFVEGSDSPSSPSETRTSLAIVSITIKSYNNFEPQFIGAPYDFWVGANAPIGTSVGQIRVAGTDDRDIVFDMFHSYNEVVPFGIEETSGIVAVTKALQDFTRDEYKLEAFVLANLLNTDQNYFELSTNVTIHVAPSSRVGSEKDIIIEFSVPENLAGGQVGSVIKSLLEMGVRIPRDPRLQLVSPDMRELFMLDENGVLYTVSALDYEEKNTYTLVIASERISLLFYVSIQVEDLNDNAPQFNAVKYEGLIEENSPQGTHIKMTPSIVVTDLDAYEGSSLKVFMIGDSKHLFTLVEDGLEVIFIGQALDREEKASYHFILKAVDDGNLTSTANLTITVEDTNDNSPEFIMRSDDFEPRYTQGKSTSREINMPGNAWNINEGKDSILSIPESIPVGSRITRVSATDKDSESFGKIEYFLTMETMFHILPNHSAISEISNDFTVESKTGSVIVTQKLQPNTFYLLNITASDNGGLKASLNIPVSVFDVNDKPPKFKQQSYTFEILEGEYVFSEIGSVHAEDQDSGDNGKLIYSIVLDDYEDAESLPFRIAETTGKILVSGNIDREKQEKYEFTVQAEDGGIPSLSDVAKVIVLIDDVNDHAPEFVDYSEMAAATDGSFLITPFYRASIEETAPPGSIVTKVQATDLDSNKTGNGIILYKLLDSSSLAIDSQYGTVYTIDRLDYETEPLLQAKIVSYDMGKPSLSSTALLSVVIEDVEDELSVRLFPQELYEVRAFENNKVRERLARIQLNPSITEGKTFKLQLVDSYMLPIVFLEPLSGDLLLLQSLDREERNQYKFKIQAVEIHKGRALQHIYSEPKNRRRNISDDITSILLLPSSTTEITTIEVTTLATHKIVNATITTPAIRPPKGTTRSKLLKKNRSGSRFGEVEALALNEAWVHLIVNDTNDNPPVFLPASSPLVAAISADAMLGDTVAKVEAVDADEGINKVLRYSIVPTMISTQSISSYFALNSSTGELKVAGDLRDIVEQKVSFDIKATDRAGDREGNNSTTSVFIHVLAQSSQLILELNAPPTEIHLHIDSLQRTLSNISGHEVRIQKVTPHVDGDAAMVQKTDVYIFGVDSLTKDFIPSKILRKSLRHRYKKIDSLLPSEISMKGIRASSPQSTEQFLKGAELAILIGALVVFLACISAIVCLCFKQRKKRRKPMPLPPGLTLGVAAQGPVPILSLPYNGHYPGPYTHMSEHSDSSESVSPQQDRTYSYQMGEKLARQLPTRTFNRVPDIHTRSGRAKTPVTHIDDDNWQWKVRQRRESNGNIVEEEEHPHVCSHHSPTTQRGQRTKSKGTHWHIRTHEIEDEEPRGAVRVSHFTTTQTLRPNHTIAQESSETRENVSCCTASRPPSPDSLERETPRISTRRSTNNRLASDVTEL